MHHRSDMIVIGSGLAGLTSAALLARDGHDVTVLDQRPPGGRARSTGPDGFALNLGPHALAMGGPGTAVLRALGVDLSGGNPLSRPPRVFSDRGVHPLTDRRGGAPGLRGLQALPGLRQLAQGSADQTVAELLDGISDDEPTRAFLSALARLGLYADAEHEVAADVLAAATRGNPARYLDGGWQRLVDQLVTIARGAGVRFNRVGADRVEVADGRVVGVTTRDGARMAADGVVVAAGGPQDAAGLLQAAPAEALRAHAAAAAPARMAVLDIALRGSVDPVGVVLGVDEPVYLAEHSRVAELCEGDGTVLHAARFLPLASAGTPGMREQLEELVDIVVPGWRDDVVTARYLPSITVTHDLPTRTRGGLAARHPGVVEGVEGLALAGDWVGPHGTLAQAALASAARAAEVVQTVVRRGERVA